MSGLLDLADGSLNAQTKEQLLMALLQKHKCTHVLYPPFLKLCDKLPALDWKKVGFTQKSRKFVPKEKGVYAFVLEMSGHSLMPVNHVLYVGKAGDLTSNNTLHARYYDYIRTEKGSDRPRIAQMLSQWKGHLSYYYAVVGAGVSTGDVEKYLLDILIPPYNRGDYSAELSSLLRGANII